MSFMLMVVTFLISTFCVRHGELISQIAPSVTLNNGYKMPIVGLGTYPLTGAQCEQAVKDAIDSGYRHIDTAYLYGNEKEVGNAVRAKIAEGVIRREDIFITTKLWSTFHAPELVDSAFNESLQKLNLGYIDLYLMHSPEAIPANTDYIDTWRAMEKLLSNGLVRSIGVSNFEIPHLQRLLESAPQIKPVTNQVECHPNKNQQPLIDYCSSQGIVITAYSPLGRPHDDIGKRIALFDPNVQLIANVHNKSAAQIILRYTVQRGAAVIPKSTHKERISANIDLFDFELDPSEMQYLHSLNGR